MRGCRGLRCGETDEEGSPFASDGTCILEVHAQDTTPLRAFSAGALSGGLVLEGQEDQFAALGLVLNAIVLWNTR